MRTSEVKRFLTLCYPSLPLGWLFYIGEPWKDYWKLNRAFACAVQSNKTIYFNKAFFKYLDHFCIESIIKHELGHVLVGPNYDINKCHNKAWYINAVKCGYRLEDEYELGRRFTMRKTHQSSISFNKFLVYYKERMKYYIPKNYKRGR